MNKEKNKIIRKSERCLLISLLFLIPVTLFAYFLSGNNKLLVSLPMLLSLSALLQLEITGLFGYLDDLEEKASKIYDESGLTPSHIYRRLYEFYNPEHPKWDFVKGHLYRNKRVGFFLAFLAGIFQLFIIWYV